MRNLVLVARRREPMEALAAELKSTGAEITIIPADLSRPGAAAALMKIVEQRRLTIDTLINNAGLGDTGRFDQENPESILSMLQVNVVALTELTGWCYRRWWRVNAARSCSLRLWLRSSPVLAWQFIMQPSPTC